MVSKDTKATAVVKETNGITTPIAEETSKQAETPIKVNAESSLANKAPFLNRLMDSWSIPMRERKKFKLTDQHRDQWLSTVDFITMNVAKGMIEQEPYASQKITVKDMYDKLIYMIALEAKIVQIKPKKDKQVK